MKKLFVIIGVPRSGTTFIYNNFQNIPEVNLLQKENHFFLTKETYINPENIFNIERYNTFNIDKHKNSISEKKINIDINTLYFYDIDSLKNIKKIYKENVHFVCILRDPKKRFISHAETLIKKISILGNGKGYFINNSMSYSKIFENLLKEEFINYSNYKKYIDLIRSNGIKVDYYCYEKLFSNSENLKNFYRSFGVNPKINTFKKVHDSKNYPIKSDISKSNLFVLIKFLITLFKIKRLILKLRSKRFYNLIKNNMKEFSDYYSKIDFI